MSLINLECDNCGRHYTQYELELCPWCEIERLRADLTNCRRLMQEVIDMLWPETVSVREPEFGAGYSGD